MSSVLDRDLLELRQDVDQLAEDVRGMREAADARAMQLGEVAEDVAQLKAASASVSVQIGDVRNDVRELRHDLLADMRSAQNRMLIVVVVALALVAGIALGTAQIDLLGVGVSVGQ